MRAVFTEAFSAAFIAAPAEVQMTFGNHPK